MTCKGHQVNVTLMDFVLPFILSSSLWLLFLDMERSLLSLLRSLFLSFFPLEEAVWEKMTSMQLYGEHKWRFARCFKPVLEAESTFSVRGSELFFEGFWIDLCSSSCNPWLMITNLITCSFIFLSQRRDLRVLYKSVQVDTPCAAYTASLVSGVRAPPVAMSGTVGVRPKPAWHLWKILEK